MACPVLRPTQGESQSVRSSRKRVETVDNGSVARRPALSSLKALLAHFSPIVVLQCEYTSLPEMATLATWRASNQATIHSMPVGLAPVDSSFQVVRIDLPTNTADPMSLPTKHSEEEEDQEVEEAIGDDVEFHELVVDHNHELYLERQGLSKSSYFLFLAFISVWVIGTMGLRQTITIHSHPSPKYNFGPIAAQQIANFRKGDGVLFNFHITHHGGTSTCQEMSKNLKSPSFSCMRPRNDNVTEDYPDYMPWSHNDTAKNLGIVHKYFQFLSWEFKKAPQFHKVCVLLSV